MRHGLLVRRIIAGFLLLLPAAGWGGSPDGDYFLEVNKGIDVFGRVYKEITSNYVDEVRPREFMDAGIAGMLASLDPYTTYFEKEETDEIDLLTNGKYGGIGVTIGYREGKIQVVTVMDGYSAQRQGVLPGDLILKVDTVSVVGIRPEQVRNLTRGVPGTEVRLEIQREGETAPLTFVLIREEIQLKNVTYSGFIEPGIGYVRLERFSREAGDEVRQAVKALKAGGEIDALILDLRGNPGGLLEAAVQVVSKFVPRGSLIVSTKGRREDSDKTYQSNEEPLLPATPLIVLTDRESASASEIVSGALQDLDRALVVGDRTFGKGLVQEIRDVGYGAKLKVTTARYYTPSGRSIQEIDYRSKDHEGLFSTLPDTAKKEFRTAGGRPVFEHGGITPDSLVLTESEGPMVEALNRKALFFRFITTEAGKLKENLPDTVTPEMLADFRTYLDDQGFDFQEDTEKKIEELRDLSLDLHYDNEVIADLDRISEVVRQEKRRAFERYENHIRHYLRVELGARLGGEQGRIKASLGDDVQLETAVSLVKNKIAFQRKIHG